jgi:hypothetical protein
MFVFLLLRRRREVKRETITKQVSSSEIRSRRDKFRTEIRTLVDILKEYLEKGLYSEGIIFGFHQFDENMKRILGIRRDSHLTPKEFSSSLELPEIITHLNWMISSFYRARYKIDTMSYQDLEGFIENLQSMKDLSIIKADIEIPETRLLEGEK